MTLIPMISAALSPRSTMAASAGGSLLQRGSYNPGAGHRPFAAVFAVGVPIALLTVVALTPMMSVITQKSGPIVVESIPITKPPEPAPQPQTQQKQQQQTPITTIPTNPPPFAGPTIFAPEEVYVLPTGTGTAPPIPYDPPAPPPAPKLVLAQLDQRYLAGFQPDYPLREQREGIEGVAKVRVLIGTDGKVKQVELVSTDSPGFFEATKKRALAKWRFKAATRGGVAEESWKEMTVRFEIRNA
jgi:protein TonB